MAFCATCNGERPESATLDQHMRRVRLCDKGHTLPDPSTVVTEAASPPMPSSPLSNKPAELSLGELPKMVRARKKELRALIKQAERELAALERLTKPARKTATVTPIKRSAS